ncbi:MAG: hypothetical protein AABW67_04930 [Nanoarchaeota archaeon]
MKNKEMINKNMNKKAVGKSTSRKLLLIGIILISIISFVFLVSALTSDERQSLQSELDNLTADLNSNGYSWLINPNNHDLNFGGNI